MTNPVLGFLRTILLYLCGSIKFVRSSIDKEFIMEDGIKFKVFRHVIIRKPNKYRDIPQAVFMIRFKPKNMTIEGNKRFSRIPMMIFMGFHGFRSKHWMVNERTGICQGVYEWDTVQDAVRYSKSVALKFMMGRSVEGSVNYRIIDKTISHFDMYPV